MDAKTLGKRIDAAQVNIRVCAVVSQIPACSSMSVEHVWRELDELRRVHFTGPGDVADALRVAVGRKLLRARKAQRNEYIGVTPKPRLYEHIL